MQTAYRIVAISKGKKIHDKIAQESLKNVKKFANTLHKDVEQGCTLIIALTTGPAQYHYKRRWHSGGSTQWRSAIYASKGASVPHADKFVKAYIKREQCVSVSGGGKRVIFN